VINVYGYTSSYSKNKIEKFLDSLYCYINANLPLILAGDFNAVENPTTDRLPPRKKGKATKPK